MITYLAIAVIFYFTYRAFRDRPLEPIYIKLGIPLLMGILFGGKQYEDGGIQKDKVATYLAVLYEKDEQPRLEWTEATKKAPWYVRFGFDSLDIKTIREGNYRLIVPKGTVLLRFEID